MVKPFNIEKTVVQAKSRTLKATWTTEVVPDLTDATDYSEIAKILQEEIDKEVIRAAAVELVKSQGWTAVTVKKTTSVDKEWCSLYIKNEYRRVDNYWYFKDQKDAHFFLLKWGS